MNYCLDTNIVIDFLRNKSHVVEAINKIENEGLFITFITLCELYKGVYLSNNSENELAVIDNFLNSVTIIGFNQESCRFFGEEYSRLRKLGKTTQEPDLMIASIAKAFDLTLITRNKKDFENIIVKLEVW
ncbi:MAG: type II toxin-antitoxin system VapC family toxin [Nanoarchaeota archaeon]